MPRFKKVAFFPYSFNSTNELVLLFIMDTRGTAKEVLYDFGGKPNEYEPTVYYTAVRTFMTLTRGMFTQGSFKGAQDFQEFKEENLYHCYQEGLKNLLFDHKYPLHHSITDNVLSIFYPLPFFKERESLNAEIQK